MDTQSARTATPRPDRPLTLHHDQFEDLLEGYLLCFADLDEGWSVSLLGYRPNPEDDRLARLGAQTYRRPVIRLSAFQMSALGGGETLGILAGDGRYLITLRDVEDVE